MSRRCSICGERIIPQYDAMLDKDVYVHNNCKGKKQERKSSREQLEELQNREKRFPDRCNCGLQITENILAFKEVDPEEDYSFECPRCEKMVFQEEI